MSDPKPVVLLAFANELEAKRYLRILGDEASEIEAALEKAPCEVVQIRNATLERIADILQKQKYRDRITIFHYGGHAGDQMLSLEKPGGGNQPASAERFAQLLGQISSLHLVFLNGCATGGHVKHLQAASIPLVITTKEKVDDTVARDFARRFYYGLAEGQTLGEAFEFARTEREAELDNPHSAYREASINSGDGVEPGDFAEWPWKINPGQGEATQWNLAKAANDPLFGLPELPKDIDHPSEPYKHLNWFARADARIFFGRSQVIRDLYQRLSDLNNEYQPILLFYGQTGVGKSSVLEAGIRPRLERDYTVIYARRDQKLGLVGTLLKSLEVEGNNLAEAWRNLEAKEGKPLMVVLDQLEEAYTRPNPRFPNEVKDLADGLKPLFGSNKPRGKLVLSFRQEKLANIYERLRESESPLKFNLKLLEALNKEEIEEAIRGPAALKTYNLTIEPDNLPQTIATRIDEDTNSAKAPTLQLLLKRLWDEANHNSPGHPKIDRELYDLLVKKGASLSEYLKNVLANPPTGLKEVVDLGLALDLLEFHVTPEGTAGQRTWKEVEENYLGTDSANHDLERGELIQELLQYLKDKYLLTDRREGTKDGTRLGHDTLAQVVREQFDASLLPGQRARRIVENRAVDWNDGQRGKPLEGYDLELFENGREGMRGLNADEVRMIEASEEAERKRIEQVRRDAEEKEQQRRAVENEKTARLKQQARSLVQFRWFSLGLAVLVLIAGGVAWYARQQQDEANRRRMVSISQALATRAGSLVSDPSQFTLATLLATQAFQFHQRNEGAVLDQIDVPLRSLLSWPILYQSNDEVDESRQILRLVFDVEREKELSNVAGHRDPSIVLLTKGEAKVEPVVLKDLQGSVSSISFSPDGKKLAWVSGNRNIHLWNLRNLKANTIEHKGTQGWVTIAFSPNGKTLASGSKDGRIGLWDIDNLNSEPRILPAHTDAVTSIAFSPDAQMVAWGGSDSTLHLLNLKGNEGRARLLKGHRREVTTVVFSPDGQTLASGSMDSTIRVWKVIEPIAEKLVMTSQKDHIYSLAYSPDGKILASGNYYQTIELWKPGESEVRSGVLGGNLSERIGMGANQIFSLSFSPDGKTLASGSGDNTIRLWNLSSPNSEPIVLKGHQGPIASLSFSPDGKTLASGSGDASIRIWRTTAALPELACWVLARNLSKAEWDRYVGQGIEYEKTCPNLPPGKGAPGSDIPSPIR